MNYVQNTCELVDEEMLTRLKSTFEENGTLQRFHMQAAAILNNNSSLCSSVAVAILTGLVGNKTLEEVPMTASDKTELHKLQLVDEVEQRNKKV